jgi:3-hydroxymyristoyl/3-hydroxydecanoyl-(acyl carrier protein) dehydratase
MSEHFAAFSFVDRITAYEPAKRARGVFAIPPDVASFPSCLVAEAVGQLAAWVSMAHIDFRGRPVAALANETRFYRDASPGDTLELAVEIESCDEDAVAYAGEARVNGERVIELIDCLGPMLPVEEFDAPAALAARFELLLGEGAPPGRFHGVTPPAVVPGESVPGRSLEATLTVPKTAPFFADHFPRRAVFPATLLLDSQIRLALALAAQTTDMPAGTKPAPVRMTHVKMRSFIAPGDVLRIGARRADDGERRILLSAQSDGRTVATARMEYAPRPA